MTSLCSRICLVALCASTLVFAACSDDTSEPTPDVGPTLDEGPPDGPQVTPDTGNLWPCDEVGKPCNAHDACAINPVCGTDKLCRPESLQNCDDGLDCTDDICAGQGRCENKPKPGACALRVVGTQGTEIRCFKKDQLKPDDPCELCDPDKDQLKWSPKNGGNCDDGDLCTKDDYCQNGVCKGTDYRTQCADQLGCTDDICDGKGGCGTPKLRADFCLIGGKCHKDKSKDATGCNTCDVNTSQSAWTPVQSHCLIGGKCYLPGEQDASGCSACDPNANPSGWTPLGGKCAIGGKCFSAGDAHPAGCAECDPTINATGWTVKVTGKCLISDTCYSSGDLDKTQCEQCDPATDKYAFTALAGKCKIDGKCYATGAQYPAGCAECDPAVNATGWTVKGSNDCLIKGVCKKAGDLDPLQCGKCDPTVDKYSFTPLTNVCNINGKCYAAGAAYPAGCAECVPATNPTGWTVTSSTDCLINGTCKRAGDLDPTQCSKCDPTVDKYSFTPLTGKCKIDGKCYSAGDPYPAGCAECDPTVNATAWTVTGTTHCLIDGACRTAGSLDTIQCSKCDPTVDKYAYTALTGKCKIDGQCYADQAPDTTGCLLCDVSKSTTSWSPAAGVTVSSYTFDGATTLPTGWSQTSSTTQCQWQISSARSISGSAIWYGNPATTSYNDGGVNGNNGTLTLAGIQIPAGKKAGMRLSLYLDIEDFGTFDLFEIRVRGSTTPLWSKPASGSTDYKKWLSLTLDLSAHAGSTIDVEFHFDTVDDFENDGEGIYIDDVTVYTGC